MLLLDFVCCEFVIVLCGLFWVFIVATWGCCLGGGFGCLVVCLEFVVFCAFWRVLVSV